MPYSPPENYERFDNVVEAVNPDKGLEFVGAPHTHRVSLQVEPEPAQAFRISQLIVEENRR